MLSVQLKNVQKELRIEEYLMTGIEQKPNYFSEKCFYYVELTFKNNNNIKKVPWIKIGGNKIDFNVVRSIKDNLDKLINNDTSPIQSETYFYEDVKVKLVLLNDEVIAISNLEETMFLLLKNIANKTISKKQLVAYISTQKNNTLKEILCKFANDVEIMANFLSNNPETLNILTDKEVSALQDSILQIESIIQDQD